MITQNKISKMTSTPSKKEQSYKYFTVIQDTSENLPKTAPGKELSKGLSRIQYAFCALGSAVLIALGIITHSSAIEAGRTLNQQDDPNIQGIIYLISCGVYLVSISVVFTCCAFGALALETLKDAICGLEDKMEQIKTPIQTTIEKEDTTPQTENLKREVPTATAEGYYPMESERPASTRRNPHSKSARTMPSYEIYQEAEDYHPAEAINTAGTSRIHG